ncbi:CDC42 small effector protein 2-like isoform X1 [Argopecten irradians]|uniref:CDC42 small effector protein 2-like isoform X1 n=1 Tax=Argopecten irradians TaxID=31199 RepID=UPI0037157F3D
MGDTLFCFTCCIAEQPQPQKRRRRIDPSMIGQPTDFRHTGHIGSRDIGNGISSSNSTMSEVQSQMSSKGGYDHVSPVNVHLNVIDLPHKHNGTEILS